MSNTKDPKNTKNNILIIASVIFVTVAVIVFVISLSIFNSGNNNGEDSSSSSDSGSSFQSSFDVQSSSSIPDGSSDVQSSSDAPESQSSLQSTSTIPESSSSTSSFDSRPSGEVDMTNAQQILENARELLGVPFEDGGSDENGFDSSGFIYYVMRESGYISCPRDITEQAAMGVSRGFDEVKEGDIMFFSNEVGGRPNFAGFYSGNGKMIGCIISSSFEGVVEVNIDGPYFREHFVAGVGIS